MGFKWNKSETEKQRTLQDRDESCEPEQTETDRDVSKNYTPYLSNISVLPKIPASYIL